VGKAIPGGGGECELRQFYEAPQQPPASALLTDRYAIPWMVNCGKEA
jgi:hypothetical protein